jgi:cytochrome c oxidase assembly protein subunit 15
MNGAAAKNELVPNRYSRLIHGLAIALTVVVFFLIWVGGLVTTYDAGMAVPDWPGTYGWNMFAYPASTWLFGPFDLLVEHGHRLLGSLAGLLSIGLVITAFRVDERKWFRWWSVFILAAVIAQGALGGARVVLDQRTFAMIHGCTGPLFFALATATAVMSSRWWRQWDAKSGRSAPSKGVGKGGDSIVGQYATGGRVRFLAAGLLLFSYSQLVLGAQLRHVTGLVSHKVFQGFVHGHLGLAAIVLLMSLALVISVWVSPRVPIKVRRAASLLAIAVLVQIALGFGTWIVNYALPWSELNQALAEYTISAKGYWESMVVTAHVAVGSLIISLSTVIVLRGWRSKAHPGAVEISAGRA